MPLEVYMICPTNMLGQNTNHAPLSHPYYNTSYSLLNVLDHVLPDFHCNYLGMFFSLHNNDEESLYNPLMN